MHQNASSSDQHNYSDKLLEAPQRLKQANEGARLTKASQIPFGSTLVQFSTQGKKNWKYQRQDDHKSWSGNCSHDVCRNRRNKEEWRRVEKWICQVEAAKGGKYMKIHKRGQLRKQSWNGTGDSSVREWHPWNDWLCHRHETRTTAGQQVETCFLAVNWLPGTSTKQVKSIPPYSSIWLKKAWPWKTDDHNHWLQHEFHLQRLCPGRSTLRIRWRWLINFIRNLASKAATSHLGNYTRTSPSHLRYFLSLASS